MKHVELVEKVKAFEKEFNKLCNNHNVKLEEVYDVNCEDDKTEIRIWIEGELVFYRTFNEIID